MKIRLYGYSDDNIMVDGAYRESVGAFNATYVLFADGSVIRGEYDVDGVWRFAAHRQGAATIDHVPYAGTRSDNDDSDAFDLLTMEAPDLALLWSGSQPPPIAPIANLTAAARVVSALRDRYSLDDRALAIAVTALSAPHV